MKRTNHLLIGGAGGRDAVADTGLLVLRLMVGLALAAAHGWGKIPPSPGFVESVAGLGFPAPVLFAWAAGLAEFAGGLCLAIGLLTRPAALLVLVTMGVAFFLRHADDPFSSKEKALLYGGIALCLLLTGAGRYSLDALLRTRARRTGSRYPR